MNSPARYLAPLEGQKSKALYVILWLEDLKPGERKVGAWLVWHANSGTGRCDPGQSRLQYETGLSRRSVTRAVQGLESAGLIARRMRGSIMSTSYQINWSKLSDEFDKFEAFSGRYSARSCKLVNANEDGGGQVSAVTLPGVSGDTTQVSAMTPELIETNPLKEPILPSDIGLRPMRDQARFHPGSADENQKVGRKLLAIKKDHAFLFAIDREKKRGRTFDRTLAGLIYERLNAIHVAGEFGDPLTGMAYRLLEDFYQEAA